MSQTTTTAAIRRRRGMTEEAAEAAVDQACERFGYPRSGPAWRRCWSLRRRSS